jgi:drug/metabolite transporter (DMT)-like permease
VSERGVLATVPADGVLAFLYLVGPGSVLAYTAYAWLLGWVVLSEPVTATLAVGATAIVAAVALVVRAEGGRASA